jgi:hypothetical protein
MGTSLSTIAGLHKVNVRQLREKLKEYREDRGLHSEPSMKDFNEALDKVAPPPLTRRNRHVFRGDKDGS